MSFFGKLFGREKGLPPEETDNIMEGRPVGGGRPSREEGSILYGPTGEPISSRGEPPEGTGGIEDIRRYEAEVSGRVPRTGETSSEGLRAKEREEKRAKQERIKAKEEELKARRIEADIVKLRTQAAKAEAEKDIREAGGRWYQKALRGAAAGRGLGTEASKYANIATKIATLGGPVKQRESTRDLYSSRGMRPLTGGESIKSMRTLTTPSGRAPTINSQRLFSMVNPATSRMRIGEMVKPSSKLRMGLSVSPIAPRQQGVTKIGQAALSEGQRIGRGMVGQAQLPKAEQEVLTEINRRGGSEVPSQIIRDLAGMGLSGPSVQNAIRSLIQKRVIRQSEERFGNESVLEVVRR